MIHVFGVALAGTRPGNGRRYMLYSVFVQPVRRGRNRRKLLQEFGQ